ncbi:hypothetical protein I6F07_32555 [Ensifer sp. IC4062]|nr:hypothetical protein [Ensifer sp. IC4062]MCA1444811.1 hypothetical protein [Ensifer sp. IC4062]
MTSNAVQQVQEDMALIARGEEIDLPWRRLRVLLDHGLVEINTPVLLGGPLAGSRTSISWTDEGREGSRPAMVIQKPGNLRQLLLGHKELESTIHCLGIEVDALAISE